MSRYRFALLFVLMAVLACFEPANAQTSGSSDFSITSNVTGSWSVSAPGETGATFNILAYGNGLANTYVQTYNQWIDHNVAKYLPTTLTSAVNVTVNVKYVGGSSPLPSYVNLYYISNLDYRAPDPGAQVFDHFGATPVRTQDTYYSAFDDVDYDTRRLLRVNLDSKGQGTFSYMVAAQVVSDAGEDQVPINISYYATAGVTNRSIGISVPGYDTGNMRKVVDPNAVTIQFQATDQYGNPVNVGVPYLPAHPAPQLPASGAVQPFRAIDIGLKLGKATERDGPDNSPQQTLPPTVPVSYVPLVTQLYQPTEHYAWVESLRGLNPSADLPRTVTIQYPQWGIESIAPNYNPPYNMSDLDPLGNETNRTYARNDAGMDDGVYLHYEWSDGLQADAAVVTHLHQAPVDNWTLLGELSEVLDNEAYVGLTFQQGEDDKPGSGDNYWSITGNLNPQNVVVQPAGVNWIQGESAAAAGFALGELFVPEIVGPYIGFGSAILGESTNFTATPTPTTEPWAYGGPSGLAGTPDQCDAVIAYWNTRGRVRQPNYMNMLGLKPGDHPCLYARWHVSGAPKTIKQYYLGNKWGADGYEGQTIQNQVDESQNIFKDDPLHGHLDYDFDFPTLHSVGAGGPVGPQPVGPPLGGGDQ